MNIHPGLIVAMVADGDEHGWGAELAFLWRHSRRKILALIDDIESGVGIREPIVIAIEEGGLRVWDGHHRLAAALALQVDVPVSFEVSA